MYFLMDTNSQKFYKNRHCLVLQLLLVPGGAVFEELVIGLELIILQDGRKLYKLFCFCSGSSFVFVGHSRS